MLLKSWAMPPASIPIDSSFSILRSSLWNLISSVMSLNHKHVADDRCRRGPGWRAARSDTMRSALSRRISRVAGARAFGPAGADGVHHLLPLPGLLVDEDEHVVEGPPQHLVLPPAGQVFRGLVHQVYAPLDVGGDDALGDGPQGDGEPLLFLQEGLFRHLPLGDIARYRLDRGDLASPS